MSACRPAWALALLLLLLAPSVGAFSTREEPLALAYPQDAAPVIFATGAVGLEGGAVGGLLVSDARDVVLRDVPELRVLERNGTLGGRESTHRGVDLVVHSGILAWSFGGGALDLDVGADYGMGLALPDLPIPSVVPAGPGAILAAPSIDGTFSWPGPVADILLYDAEASLLDASGKPLPGWDRRAVNAGSDSGDDSDSLGVALRASGAFQGVLHAGILLAGAGNATGLALTVAPAAEDRFSDTLDALEELGRLTGSDEGEDVFGDENPLRALESFSGVLNGALVVSGTLPDGGEAEPLVATLGGEPFDVGPLALVRGDMRVSWDDGRVQMGGTPTVAISRAGFAVEETASVAGLVPILSLVLWILAVAAIVVYFVKRPPKAEGSLTLRLVSMAVHVLALLAVFWWWDHSFAQTFGTSVITLLREGTAFDDPARLGTIFALETLPWGLAVVCFALPVRIALGVGLRYLGKGKAFKGIAKAGGFVALGILGPLYALWLLNAAIGFLAPWIGSMLPG